MLHKPNNIAKNQLKAEGLLNMKRTNKNKNKVTVLISFYINSQLY